MTAGAEKLMDTKISVIIPVYNVRPYLAECIESVLAQTYSNSEIILIDDGSTDGSGEICDEYAAKYGNITVKHQKNLGLSAARNAGTDLAGGDYLYYLDSDDCIVPQALECFVKTALQYNADMVICNATVINENSEEESDNTDFVHKVSYSSPMCGKKLIAEQLTRFDFFPSVPLLFIKRECMDDIRFLDGIIHEDELFTFELYVRSQAVAYLPMRLYRRRVRTGSIMATKIGERNLLSLITIADMLQKKFGSSADDDTAAALRLQYRALGYVMIEYYSRLSHPEKRRVRAGYVRSLKTFRDAGADIPLFKIKLRKLITKLFSK